MRERHIVLVSKQLKPLLSIPRAELQQKWSSYAGPFKPRAARRIQWFRHYGPQRGATHITAVLRTEPGSELEAETAVGSGRLIGPS